MPCPRNHRSPVALTTRPSGPADRSIARHRAHTEATTRRHDAISPGSPECAVRAKAGAGLRPQNIHTESVAPAPLTAEPLLSHPPRVKSTFLPQTVSGVTP